MLVILPLLCAVCAAFVGYRAGAVAWRRKQKEDEVKGVELVVHDWLLMDCCNKLFSFDTAWTRREFKLNASLTRQVCKPSGQTHSIAVLHCVKYFREPPKVPAGMASLC